MFKAKVNGMSSRRIISEFNDIKNPTNDDIKRVRKALTVDPRDYH